jgi:hypothetical protein
MTTFPGSPRLLKGAIVGIDPFNPLASVIISQYNPKGLSRQIQAQTASDRAGPEVLRLTGAPKEAISIQSLEIDAADQLEVGDPIAASTGIYPQLSALEMLLYPKSSVVIANTALLLAGTIELVQPEMPLTLFIWGVQRIVPVRIEGFTIQEQEYDPMLNPIRAEVTGLSMQVLSYKDFPVDHPGHGLFLAHQVVKEAMATIGSVSNIASIGGGVSL